MKRLLSRGVSLLFPLAALANSQLPDDQFLVIFGSSGYILYKVLDFANDHGFRYIKILSYDFTGFEHAISGHCETEAKEGLLFELKDENASISFLCFEKAPEDHYIIDLEKYRSLLDDLAEEE